MPTSRITMKHNIMYKHTHPFNGLLSGTQVSRYQKVKPILILLKQETVSGSGISWAICKSALRSRQIKAKFHYTGPTGPARTRARPGPQTRVSDKIRGLCPVGSGRARVVEFSYNHASTPTQFFTGRMPFLLPNRQRQSIEGNSTEGNYV